MNISTANKKLQLLQAVLLSHVHAPFVIMVHHLENTWTMEIYTVKLARANLPAMAAGILFRRWNYPQMQAKISAGNDCLRFPQVTGGNLPAPAGNLREAIIVRVRVDFLKPRDVSFYPVPNILTEVTTCCLWSQR